MCTRAAAHAGGYSAVSAGAGCVGYSWQGMQQYSSCELWTLVDRSQCIREVSFGIAFIILTQMKCNLCKSFCVIFHKQNTCEGELEKHVALFK